MPNEIDVPEQKTEAAQPKKYPRLAGWVSEDFYADEAGVVVTTLRRWFDKLGLRYRKPGATRFYNPTEVAEAMSTGEAPPQPRRRRGR